MVMDDSTKDRFYNEVFYIVNYTSYSVSLIFAVGCESGNRRVISIITRQIAHRTAFIYLYTLNAYACIFLFTRAPTKRMHACCTLLYNFTQVRITGLRTPYIHFETANAINEH